MLVQYRQTFVHYRTHGSTYVERTFAATDLEVRWLLTWKSCSTLALEETAFFDENQVAEIRLDAGTLFVLSPTDDRADRCPFIVEFLEELSDEPADVLERFIAAFTVDELEQIAELWKFPDYCCTWRPQATSGLADLIDVSIRVGDAGECGGLGGNGPGTEFDDGFCSEAREAADGLRDLIRTAIRGHRDRGQCIPYTDAGIAVISGIVRAAVDRSTMLTSSIIHSLTITDTVFNTNNVHLC